MKVGDLVKWTGYINRADGDITETTIGLVVALCDTYFYVRWTDGILDEYKIDNLDQYDLEVISETKE